MNGYKIERGLFLKFLLISLFVLGIGGLFFWQVKYKGITQALGVDFSRNNTVEVIEAPKDLEVESDNQEKIEWKSFSSKEFGMAFEYPDYFGEFELMINSKGNQELKSEEFSLTMEKVGYQGDLGQFLEESCADKSGEELVECKRVFPGFELCQFDVLEKSKQKTCHFNLESEVAGRVDFRDFIKIEDGILIVDTYYNENSQEGKRVKDDYRKLLNSLDFFVKATSVQWTIYENNKFNFSLEYPGTWTVQEEKGLKRVYFVSDKNFFSQEKLPDAKVVWISYDVDEIINKEKYLGSKQVKDLEKEELELSENFSVYFYDYTDIDLGRMASAFWRVGDYRFLAQTVPSADLAIQESQIDTLWEMLEKIQIIKE